MAQQPNRAPSAAGSTSAASRGRSSAGPRWREPGSAGVRERPGSAPRRRLPRDRAARRVRGARARARRHGPAQRDVRAARAGGHGRHRRRLPQQRQDVPQRVLALEGQAVRSRPLRRRPLEERALRSAGRRAGVLRHPLAHERVRAGLQPSRSSTSPTPTAAFGSTTCRRARTPSSAGTRAKRARRGPVHGRRRGWSAGATRRARCVPSERRCASVIADQPDLSGEHAAGHRVDRLRGVFRQQPAAQRGRSRAAARPHAKRPAWSTSSARRCSTTSPAPRGSSPTCRSSRRSSKLAIAPTVEPIARDYQQQAGSDLFLVTDPDGQVLAAVGGSPRSARGLDGRRASRARAAARRRWRSGRIPTGVLQVVSVPVTIGLDRPEVLGTLTVGYLLDDERAALVQGADRRRHRVRDRRPGARVDARPRGRTRTLASLLDCRHGPAHDDRRQRVRGARHSRCARRPTRSRPAPRCRMAIVLRSRTERMRTLSAIQTGLGIVARGHGPAGRRRQLRRRAHRSRGRSRESPITCGRSPRPAT